MFYNSLKVGFFLAIREIKKSSILANGLIIMVMMLTFLNLMVGRGVLIGLPEGATNSFKTQYAGDLIITKLKLGKVFFLFTKKNPTFMQF